MEDWLENNHYLNLMSPKEKKYIYMAIEPNNYIISDRYKALDISKKNNCKVIIYIETEENIYKQTSHYYLNGILHKIH